MILQSSTELPSEINENGCYFMSLLFLASQKLSQSYDIETIKKIKREVIDKGFMTSACWVDDPGAILDHLGLKNEYTDKHEPPTREAADDEIEILYFRHEEFGHFVAGIGGKVAYDPLGMSNSVRLGTLRSKRIFKIL